MQTLVRHSFAVLLLVCTIVGARAGDLADALQRYKEKTNAALLAAAPDTPPAVLDYLRACLANAARLTGFETDSAGVSAIFQDVARLRVAGFRALPAGTSGHPGVRVETQAYNETLQPFAADNALEWYALQNELLSRKYFKTSTSKTSNFLEGYINGQLNLTRADPALLRVRTPPRPLGVSPWEAIVRFEPALAMRDGPNAAILGAGGLSYTFFPDISDATPPRLIETFRSRTVRKAGVRLGAGAGRFGDKTRFIFGPGVQVSALGIWALYEPKAEAWMLGVSMADLTKLKKMIGWFE